MTTYAQEQSALLEQDVRAENVVWLQVLRGVGSAHHEALTDRWCLIRDTVQAELSRQPGLRRRLG